MKKTYTTPSILRREARIFTYMTTVSPGVSTSSYDDSLSIDAKERGAFDDLSIAEDSGKGFGEASLWDEIK